MRANDQSVLRSACRTCQLFGLCRLQPGPLAGGQLIAVGSGPSDLLAGLAGKMIVPDHPSARDASAGEERLAAVAGALRRGLPLEWTTPD
jgi:hypothetical protein